MPKVTRKSAAAAAAAAREQEPPPPSRNARPVFGDVSNNSKGQKPSTATKTKRTSRNNATNPPITRRRSSRLSGVDPEEAIDATTISTSNIQASETAVANSNNTTQESAPITTRRTRSFGKTNDEKEKPSNPSSLPNIRETSESSSDPTEDSESETARSSRTEKPAPTRAARASKPIPEQSEGEPSTRKTRSSKAKQSKEDPTQQSCAAVTVGRAKETSTRPARGANKRKAREQDEAISGTDDAHLAEEIEQLEEKKRPARNLRSKKGKPKEEEPPTLETSTSQVAKLEARKQTRAGKGREQAKDADEPPAKQPAKRTRARKEPPDNGDEEPVPPARRTRAASKGRAGQGESASMRTATNTTDEEEVAPPAATTAKGKGKVKSEDAPAQTQDTTATSSEAEEAEPNDATIKPTRGRSGRRAAATKSDLAEPNKAPRRSSRSTSRAAATTTTAKGSVTTGKASGKTDAGGKSAPSKRGRQSEQQQQPRKTARLSRSKSTARTATRPKISNPYPDFLQQNDFRLFREDAASAPFDPSKFTRGIAPVDLPNKGRVEEVTDYVTDIMQRLFDREVSTRPHPYMNEQPTLNTNMRSILVDWLVEVHMKFRLEAATLYLCVNIIDRFLERSPTERSRLQLVGVTALLVACKIEEIYPPEVRDCVYICDRAYTRQDVLDMEATILRTLDYSVTAPTGHPFLVRFLHIAKATKLQKHAANYYMERMLQEYTCLKHRPSLIAASCVALALNNRSIRVYEGLDDEAVPGVPNDLVEYTGFDTAKIVDVAEKVSLKVQNTQVTNSRRELIAVKRKYESSRYHYVASTEYFDHPQVQDILAAYQP